MWERGGGKTKNPNSLGLDPVPQIIIIMQNHNLVAEYIPNHRPTGATPQIQEEMKKNGKSDAHTSREYAKSFLSLFDALSYFQGGYANAFLSLFDPLQHIQGVCQIIFVAT